MHAHAYIAWINASMLKYSLTIHMHIPLGEFGVVYRGHILKNMGQIVTDVAAVKTLKGTIQNKPTFAEALPTF